jgi:hypothetical protein
MFFPLSRALSRPPSPLSSFPPDVDVPLPLWFEPVVAGVLDAELAAGSPVLLVAAGPPGDVCASAMFAVSRIAPARVVVLKITCRHRYYRL